MEGNNNGKNGNDKKPDLIDLSRARKKSKHSQEERIKGLETEIKKGKEKLRRLKPPSGSKSFRGKEILDILITWTVFGIMSLLFYRNRAAIYGWGSMAAIYFLISGASIILHELGHKFVSRKFGAKAEYRANYPWLGITSAISIISSLARMPFLIFAPGAVHTVGWLTGKQIFQVKAAGPAINIILAGLALAACSMITPHTALYEAASYCFALNSLLAAFNLIPVADLDGKAMREYSLKYYLFLAIPAASLFLLSQPFI